MPSSVKIAGSRVTYVPGVYTTVDASSLNATSPQASGIVAIIGPAVGGKPYTAIASRRDVPSFTNVSQLANQYSGDLLEAANLCFSPSGDTGGAQTVVALKTNPSTQAKLQLNGISAASVLFTAQEWGAGGNGISITIGSGSTKGVALSIAKGNLTERGDNLAGEAVATLRYATAPGSYSTLTGTLQSGLLTAQGSLGFSGKAADLAASSTSSTAPVAIQASQADDGALFTIWGTDSAGAALTEQITLSAGVNRTQASFKSVLGAGLDRPALSVVVTDAGGTTLLSLLNNAQSVGTSRLSGVFVANGQVKLASPAAGTVLLIGQDASGNRLAEAVSLSAAGTSTVGLFSQVQWAIVGGVDSTATVTLSAQALKLAGQPSTALSDIAKTVAGLLDGSGSAPAGFTLGIVNQEDATLFSSLGAFANVDLTSPVGASLTSDLEALVDWVNGNSVLVTAQAVAGAKGLPQNTAAPIFLSGGGEGISKASDFLACLTLLQQVRANIVVCLSLDDGVNLAATHHCDYMTRIGKSERTCFVGLSDLAGTKPANKARMYQLAQEHNAAGTTVCPNGLINYDTQGNLRTFLPQFFAAAAAGMRAGAAVGTPLTRKRMAVVGVTQDSSWDPIADADDLLAHGIFFASEVDNVGVRIERDVTSYTSTDNEVYSAGAIYFANCYAVYVYRLSLEAYIGRANFSGTLNQIIIGAKVILDQLVSVGAIYGYQDPTGSIVRDAVYLDQTWNPAEEINFILPTIRLANPVAAVAA